MRLFRVSLCVVFLMGCAGSRNQQAITLSPHTDLDAIQLDQNYVQLKDKYSVRHEINFGPDVDLTFGAVNKKQTEGPDRKVVFTTTLWDTPLIKAYLKDQNVDASTSVGEELKTKLLQEHRDHTQLILSVTSIGRHYFKWKEWTHWLEDAMGRIYFSGRTQVSSMHDKKKKIFKEEGTLYFQKLNLSKLSPLKFVLLDQDELRRIEFDFIVEGHQKMYFNVPGSETPAQVQQPVEEEPTVTADAPVEDEPVLSKKEQMKSHFETATVYYRNGKYHDAIREWQNVLKLDPTHVLSRKKIDKANRLIEAQQREEQLVSKDQEQKKKKVHFILATEHYKAGSYEAAIREWNEVLAIDPEHELSKQKIEKAKARLETDDLDEVEVTDTALE